MSSPVPASDPPAEVADAGLPSTFEPAVAGMLTECPQCGEHWPTGHPYCSNCGWAPGVAADTPATLLRRPMAWAASLALAVAAGLAVGWWTRSAGPQTVAAASEPLPPAPVPASAPAPALAPPVASAAASAASAVTLARSMSPDVSPAVLAVQAVVLDHAQAQAFARDWLAAESAAGDEQSTSAGLRPFYADSVAYRGQPHAEWGAIVADKSGFIRRWPRRDYELLAVQRLDEHAGGDVRLALRVRWQLESQGRWRRGESVTVLTLRHLAGRWRIVAEQAGAS